MSLARIAVARGTSTTSIRKHMKAGGWVRLVGTKKLRPGRKGTRIFHIVSVVDVDERRRWLNCLCEEREL